MLASGFWNDFFLFVLSKIYVTNLPRDVFEDTLLPLFAECGVVYKLRLMMCFSGSNRGFAYVVFACREAAQRALMMYVWLLNHPLSVSKHLLFHSFARFPLYQRIIFAHKSSNKRVLLMGNISAHIDDNWIINYCCEITNCSKVIRVIDSFGTVKVLLLHYKSHYEAAMARRVLMIRIFDFGEKCYVKWHVKKWISAILFYVWSYWTFF